MSYDMQGELNRKNREDGFMTSEELKEVAERKGEEKKKRASNNVIDETEDLIN